jgi:hypothetical protein
MAPAVLDATQQQRSAVLQERGAGVEHGVDGIRPIGSGQDGILDMSMKERFVLIRRWSHIIAISHMPVGRAGVSFGIICQPGMSCNAFKIYLWGHSVNPPKAKTKVQEPSSKKQWKKSNLLGKWFWLLVLQG